MRPRTLLVLAVLVAGLLAFIWFFERDLPSSEERREQANKVLNFEASRVTGVTVERQDQRIELRRVDREGDTEEGDVPVPPEENEWRIEAPLRARADESLVDDFLAKLSSLDKERTLEDVVVSEVGLETPRARVTVLVGDRPAELSIGAEIPASSSMVVGLGGTQQAFVVNSGLWSDLERAAGDWRSREAFSASSEDIERLTLDSGSERVLLARRGKDFWIEAPLADRADADKISDLLFDLTGLEIESFVDHPAEPLSQLGLEPPVGVVEVAVKDREELFRLELGSSVPDDEKRLYARVASQIFEMDSELSEAVMRPVEEWRSHSWSSLESYQIDTLRVSEGESELVLERSGAEWKRGEEEISFAPVSDFLYAITGAAAERVLSDEEATALDFEPLMKLTLSGEDKEQELQLYPAHLEGHPARASDRDAVLLLSPEQVQELRAKLGAVRDAPPTAGSESPESESSQGDEE